MQPGFERSGVDIMEGMLNELFFPRSVSKEGDVPNEDSLRAFQSMLSARGLTVKYDNLGALYFDSSQSEAQANAVQLEIPTLQINPEYVFPRAYSFILYESKVGQSRDAFNIYNSRNETIMTAKGKIFSWGKSIHIFNMQEKAMVLIDQKHLHLHRTYNICNPSNKKVFAKVQKHILAFRSTYDVISKTGDKKGKLIYRIEGNFSHYNFNIRNSKDQILASVRERDGINNMQNKNLNTYEVRCEPGVDCLMILALAIVCDCVDND